jgi:hypothetical protein
MKKLCLFALIVSLAAAVPALAQTTLCPNAAAPATNSSGYGPGYSATYTGGTLDATCGINSAVQLYIGNDTSGYARLAWTNQGTGGVPAGLTLGDLTGLDASVIFSADVAVDQPFYEITVQDATDPLGLTSSSDQLMFLEFQPTNLVGTNMAASAGTTLFNMYDNTSGVYLNGPHGQQDAQTLDYWFTQYPDLSGEAITSLRVGIGMDGGCNSEPCSETAIINSLVVNPAVSTPEGGSQILYLLLAGLACFAAMFLSRRLRSARTLAN